VCILSIVLFFTLFIEFDLFAADVFSLLREHSLDVFCLLISLSVCGLYLGFSLSRSSTLSLSVGLVLSLVLSLPPLGATLPSSKYTASSDFFRRRRLAEKAAVKRNAHRQRTIQMLRHYRTGVVCRLLSLSLSFYPPFIPSFYALLPRPLHICWPLH
jgi:hypothetical protein